jgi:multidrug resistance protein, MATE family
LKGGGTTTTGGTTGGTAGFKPILARLKALSPTFLKLAGPGAAMMAIEAWAFEVTTLLAGYLGTVALDAHLTMLQLATLAFLSLPFAVAIASTIRVGNLLGAGDAAGAADASKVTFAICFAFTGICALLFSLLRNVLGYVFTNDKEVVHAVAKIAPIAALFQLADGGQAAAGGVFRGMGRQTTVAVRNFFGFWVFGMPVGAVLTFAVGGTALRVYQIQARCFISQLVTVVHTSRYTRR